VRDAERDPAALESLQRLQVQRRRLADRMRPPWWYLTGIAVMYALVFAVPFGQRYRSQGLSLWPIVAAALAVACLMQWGLARATGIRVGFRNLRYPASGRPVRIAVVEVSLAAIATEHFLIDRGLLAAAIATAALAVAAEVALLQAALRGIRQELRAGGGTG
jgi:threonine/homoserine efflux transporter RhtA